MRCLDQTISGLISCAISVLASACAGDMGDGGPASGRGQFTVPWVLQDPDTHDASTCASLFVDHVDAKLTNMGTGDVLDAVAPCAAGTLLTDPLPIGDYEIELHAYSAAGAEIDTSPGAGHGALLADADHVVLPPLLVPITPVADEVHFHWHAPANCGDLRIHVLYGPDARGPMGDWSCDAQDPTLMVPVPRTSSFFPGIAVLYQPPDMSGIDGMQLPSLMRGRERVDIDVRFASWP